jgi:DNA-binding NtrC family response regulator
MALSSAVRYDSFCVGAVDFLQKPFEAETIDARINQLYHIWRLERENRRLKKRVQFQFGFDQLIGNSAVMLKLKKMILQVAESDASVLIQGATGTGKELVARAIHFHSQLPDGMTTDSLAAYEFAALRNALSKYGGHRKNAARMLGIGEATLYRKLNKYDLS